MAFTRDIVNGFRYQVAVNEHGRDVLVQILKWTYKGRNLSIKKYFESQGRPKKEYKQMFNASQHRILDKEIPYLLNVDATFRGYDLSLLFVVLQNFCGLERPNSDVWKTPGSGKNLEHLIYKLKQERNNIAHTKVVTQMSDKKLATKLKWLKRLLSRILRMAGIVSRQQPHIPRVLISGIKQEFKYLLTKVREPLDPNDLSLLPQLQNEITVFRNIIQNNVKEASRQELHDLYPQLWDVTLAQWLYPDLKVQPSLNFTNLIIKEDLTRSMHSHTQPRTVSHKELLQVRRRDGDLPEVLIISGEGGMGKTTLLKFMIETWVEDPTQIAGLENISHLMYFQLRGSNICSLKDMLKNVFLKTFQESRVKIEYFEEFFLNFGLVFLLDGYDEANEESKKLITDLLNFQQGNMRFVITTRPGCLNDLIHITEQRKKIMNIEIKGIRREDRSYFVDKTLSEIVQEPSRRDELKGNIIAMLEAMTMEVDELDIPLTMTLVIIREVEDPDQRSADIYEDLTILMMGKITERLAVQRIDDAESKVKDYYSAIKKVSLRGLMRKEHDLWPETVEELKAKCCSLQVPYKEMLSGFFTSKRTRKGLSFDQTWSFPHSKFQEHWAAGFIYTHLITCNIQWMTEPDKEEFLPLQKHPLMRVLLENSEEVKQFLIDNEGNGDLLIDLLCKFACFSFRRQKAMIDSLVPVITSLLLYSKCSRHVRRRRCSENCRLLDIARSLTNVLEVSVNGLQDSDTLDVYESFCKELVAIIDHFRPQDDLRPNDDEPEDNHTCEVDSEMSQLISRFIEILTQENIREVVVPKLIDFGKNAFVSIKKIMELVTASEGMEEMSSIVTKVLDMFK